MQFVVHFLALIFLFDQSKSFQLTVDQQAGNSSLASDVSGGTDTKTLQSTATTIYNNNNLNNSMNNGTSDGFHTEFKPSLVNSTIYVIWLSVQIATFMVNYKGHPFMQSLRNNRPLCFSFMIPMFVVFSCVNNWIPSLSEQLSIVEFPLELKSIVIGTILGTFALTLMIDRLCDLLFGRLTLEPL